MKRVIDGLLYNTETAQLIGFSEFGHSGDFRYRYEALYRTPRGRYFVQYSGGPLSCYAKNEGPNSIGGDSGIFVLNADEAMRWCEEHAVDTTVVMNFFTVGDA